MFDRVSHTDGLKRSEDEILFFTRFGYLFPEASRSKLCLLPEAESTVAGLRALGGAMAVDDGSMPLDSTMPAITTYLGQFIDHDITARTDRDSVATFLGRNEPIAPGNPDTLAKAIRNGRRPQFDLDSVFGEGPAFSPGATSQSQILYNADLTMKLFEDGGRRDVIRTAGGAAIIPDGRNDENVQLNQLQFAFVKFYNEIRAAQPAGTDAERHIRSRQLARWAFEYVVVHDWLPTVCQPDVVADTLANGPRFFGHDVEHAGAFMPFEFSSAAFRFAHSLIRPAYLLNGGTPAPIPIMDLLGFAGKPDFLDAASSGTPQLKEEFALDFGFFVAGGPNLQFTRKIDTQIAKGLGTLPLGTRATDPVLSHLARSNLLRAYSLSIPIGQAMADAFAIHPLTPKEILDGESQAIADVLEANFFHHRTPLWYYVLREAAVQRGGDGLGEVGSRIIAETIIGQIKSDHNSYLNNCCDDAVCANGIDVRPGLQVKSSAGGLISNLPDLLRFAGLVTF